MVAMRTVGLIFLLIIGLTAGIGGFLGSQYVDDELQSGIADNLSIPIEGEDGYDEFISNVDAELPTYRNYYFWNLTNPDTYLTGAEPEFEELGPYAYQQFNIKFNVQYSSDNTEVSYQTYTYYEFSEEQSFAGASMDDKIVNINPAYLGVINGAGSEYNLVTGFVGPAMESILDGLTGDFTDAVLYQGSAQALEGIENEAVENFEFAVNATTTANVIEGNHAALVGATDITTGNSLLFNDQDTQGTYGTSIQGVSEWATGGLASLSYSNDTIRKLLHDGPDGIPVPGIFEDLATGTGVLGFLQLYENATNELGGLNNATLQAVYGGASQTQLDAFAGYLAQYLIDSNPVIAGAYLASTGGQQTTQEAAYTNLYSQWVNATFVPAGLDINGDGIDDDGFEISLVNDYEISNATVTALFNSSNPYALTNAEQGIFVWLQAAAGNTTLQGLLSLTYADINATEMGAIFLWLAEFTDFTTGLGTNLALAQIAVNSGYAPGEITADNLAYLHWAQPTVTGGLTLDQLSPDAGLPGSVELWDNSDVDDMNVSNVMAILTTDTGLSLTSTDGVGYFLQQAATLGSSPLTAQAAINTAFGAQLEIAEIAGVAAYIGYIQQVFVLQATLQPIFDLGGGLITDRSVNDWLFEAQDPLLAFLAANGQDVDPDAALFLNATSQADPDIAAASTINTGRTDISLIKQYVNWQGQTSLDVWEAVEVIEGTDATQFAPGVDSEDTLTAYVSDLLRVIDFVYSEDMDVKGIDTLKYVIPDSVLAVDANYYQTITGLANMTGSAGIPLFLSKPHFLDAAVSLLDAVTGLSPDAAAHDTYLAVEPTSGTVFDARKRLQVNFDVSTGNYITTGVSDTMMPVLWIEDAGTIPDDSAESFKDVVYGAQNTADLLLRGGLAAGVVISLAAIWLLVRPKV